MKLTVGERLEGAGPAHQPGGYVVTSVVRETPWYGLYLGKKIFYNFDFTAKRVRETDDVEWLDVFLRTIRYPVLDDPTYVQQRRALARAEARAVLGSRHSNLWPEPLDLLEVENTRDPFTFADAQARAGEPVLVFTRPQGRFTPQWQQQVLPIASILSVLAELLEFLKQAHAEGLLLLGLGPSALLIDASDRVHYLGTEMVLSQQSILLKDATPAAVWQRLFPADRFARGYAAPECFDPTRRPDVRSDLYAWGALAFSLLTGIELGKVAQEQGRPWTTFTDAHGKQLEQVLAQLPRNNVVGWAEQLGVPAEALVEGWPGNALSAFRLLLHPEPARRPGSVAELRAWLIDPPPSPVTSFLALYTNADEATLLFDLTGVDPELEVQVQCQRGVAPLTPTEGATVVQGPPRPVVRLNNLPLTEATVYYTAFTRRASNGRVAHSPGLAAPLWYVDGPQLRAWAESEASKTDVPTPTRVSMVLGTLDVFLVAESLRSSPSPRVRGWGLRRIEQALKQGASESLQALVWQYVTDASVELRQSAAALWWAHQSTRSDALLLRLVEALGSAPADAPMPLAAFLRQLQIPEDRIARLLQQREARRPVECPLCQQPLAPGERDAHLRGVHGYVVFEGELVAADAALARRWDRVFYQQDAAAHEQLLEQYLNLPDVRRNLAAALEPYQEDLQRILLGASRDDTTIPVALPYAAVIAYQSALRASKHFVPIVQRLLRAGNERLRDLAGQTLVPHLQNELRARPSAIELKKLLATFCPDVDQTGTQLDLCRQLGAAGVDPSLLGECVALLQQEHLVVCPECRAKVQAKNLELHLRRAHQVYQFRNQRGDYHAMRAAIVDALCTSPPDVEAWRQLHSLAEDKHPGQADRFIVNWLFQNVKEVGSDERGATVKNLTEVIVAAGAAAALLPICISTGKNATWALLGQRVALELVARMPAPIAPELVPSVMPLLDIKELPRRTRENAVLALLRSVGKDSPRAIDILRAYVAQSGKKRALEKLQQVEQRFGHSPALERLSAEFEAEIRMTCPRCTTELRQKDMVVHLWDQHHLVLDGERVREPWRVIEDWIVDYGLEKDARVLQRCRELALRDDPQAGLPRLQRLLYRRGLRDDELLAELRTQIQDRASSLCPHCCARVAIPESAPVTPIALTESSLEGYGYEVAVAERGLVPSLRIESPRAIVHQGREPGRLLTRTGAVLLLCGPLVPAIYVGIHLATGRILPEVLVWTLAVGAGLVASGGVALLWPSPRPARERLFEAAWNLLVPDLLEDELGRREWGFLHGLIERSRRTPVRRELLRECCERASLAAGDDPVALACLTALSRRYLADAQATREDPAPFVLALAADCVQGRLPASFLGTLLEICHDESFAWPRSDRLRLTILLADLAFDAKVELDDWLNLGRAFPVLNKALGLDPRSHWLQFHAIRRDRDERPWKQAGKALTMLDLAHAAAEYTDLLTHYPDVLLYAPRANLVIGSKGVWIEGVCVSAYPDGDLAVRRVDRTYELHIGGRAIPCVENPTGYLDEMRGWLRWYFHEFLPGLPGAWQPLTESRHRLWQRDRLDCPECGRPFVPCLGDLGIAVR